jgi:BolA family transcriptional regulator, general stress-responsive regulator
MTVSDRIQQKLTTAFAPLALEVLDESERHAGHAGYRPGGESHFRIAISAEAFRGKSRIERHRMINELLREELNSGVHAVAIRALAPGENGGT